MYRDGNSHAESEVPFIGEDTAAKSPSFPSLEIVPRSARPPIADAKVGRFFSCSPVETIYGGLYATGIFPSRVYACAYMREGGRELRATHVRAL